MKNKNENLLGQFIDYCEKHPEQRFWQALRNWSEYNFISGSKTTHLPEDFEDTFYKEGR